MLSTGGGVCLSAGRHPPGQTHTPTPIGQTPPWTPWADTSLGRHPWAYTSQADNPLDKHPLGRHPPADTPWAEPQQSLQWMICILLECILVDIVKVLTVQLKCFKTANQFKIQSN